LTARKKIWEVSGKVSKPTLSEVPYPDFLEAKKNSCGIGLSPKVCESYLIRIFPSRMLRDVGDIDILDYYFENDVADETGNPINTPEDATKGTRHLCQKAHCKGACAQQRDRGNSRERARFG